MVTVASFSTTTRNYYVMQTVPSTRFGAWLSKARRERKISQESLGKEVDLTKAQISRIESGKQQTKQDTAIRIARALGRVPEEALMAMAEDALVRASKDGELPGYTSDEIIRIAQDIEIRVQRRKDVPITPLDVPDAHKTVLENIIRMYLQQPVSDEVGKDN